MSNLNLYLIKQDYNKGYDTFDSAVVAAKTSIDARLMDPVNHDEWKDYADCMMDYWCDPIFVEVVLLGVASADANEGVVCASYNSG